MFNLIIKIFNKITLNKFIISNGGRGRLKKTMLSWRFPSHAILVVLLFNEEKLVFCEFLSKQQPKDGLGDYQKS
jgi:hypothetical protein